MPIQFICPSCQQRLSVGSRKAGSMATCPKCGSEVSVPSESSESPPLEPVPPLVPPLPPPPFEPPLAESHVRHDDAAEVSAISGTSMPLIVESPPLPSSTPPRVPSNVDFDPDSITIERRVLYFQGILLAGVALLSFVLGYWIGAWGPEKPIGEADAAKRGEIEEPPDPILIAGRITYEGENADRLGDGGAVIILLPATRQPEEPIDADGLPPGGPEPPADGPALSAISALGGTYYRAGGDGNVEMIVPRPGKYFVLRLSNEARRPRGNEPDGQTLAILGRYFRSAADLLGSKKYSLTPEDIAAESELSHHFGRSGD